MPRVTKKKVKKPVKVIKRKPVTLKERKDIVLKALTDPKFRATLSKNPAKTFGVSKLSEADAKIVKDTLSKLAKIEKEVASLADTLLCASGGCGIA